MRLRGLLEIAATTAVMWVFAYAGRQYLRPGVALDDAMRLVFFVGVFGWALVLEARLRSMLRGVPLSRSGHERTLRSLAGRYRVGYRILVSCGVLLLVAALWSRA